MQSVQSSGRLTIIGSGRGGLKWWIGLALAVLVQNPGMATSWQDQLVAAAQLRTSVSVTYDGGYRSIPYPGGDVADDIGVCTDLVVRSYRRLGLDLQKLLHEDMSRHFSDYPSRQIWGLQRPDSNIDHRRVPNLQRYFQRAGAALAVSEQSADYLPGDLVTWMLPGNLPHIGIVSNDFTKPGSSIRKIVHNIGAGPEISDILFKYPITGHYRFDPLSPQVAHNQ